ncbi:membrane protein [Beggiatoa sp. PS]|nr:membrane protein [Beggiatoa sp. PS]
MNLNIRKKTLLMVVIITVSLLIVLGIFQWQQKQLHSVFYAVNEAIQSQNAFNKATYSQSKSQPSAFGTTTKNAPSLHINYKLSGNILGYLNNVQLDKTNAGEATLRAVNKNYLHSLIITLAIAVFSASILSLLAYIIAMQIDGWEAQNKLIRATFLEYLFDTLPYILWSIIWLSFALTLFGNNPASTGRYFFVFVLYLFWVWYVSITVFCPRKYAPISSSTE